MNITLHQLKAFQAIAKFQSITKAAEAMSMTQPAVSIQLKNLQEQFEVPLTEIIGKRIHITEFGQELVDTADRIFGELGQIEEKMLELKGLLGGKIRISAVASIGLGLVSTSSASRPARVEPPTMTKSLLGSWQEAAARPRIEPIAES
jgi:DNA-binding transcriptional LysR family regulator